MLEAYAAIKPASSCNQEAEPESSTHQNIHLLQPLLSILMVHFSLEGLLSRPGLIPASLYSFQGTTLWSQYEFIVRNSPDDVIGMLRQFLINVSFHAAAQ